MSVDPLLGFLFVGLFSPGPNVILLTASGARFGVVATAPHLAGVVLGTGIIAFATGLGLGAVLAGWPALRLVLQIVACGWILWMARGLWQAQASAKTNGARPMRFPEAVLFQWVNPKVWAVALTALVAFPGGGTALDEALRLGAAFAGVNLGVCLFWTAAGQGLRALLRSPRAWQIFNRVMAAVLAGFSIMVFL